MFYVLTFFHPSSGRTCSDIHSFDDDFLSRFPVVISDYLSRGYEFVSCVRLGISYD